MIPGRSHRPAALAVLATALVLAGCAPMSPERAAEVCEERARAALGPTGEAKIGVGSDGIITGVGLTITSDYITGRDPYDVYERCVRQKTGQGPIRPPDLEP